MLKSWEGYGRNSMHFVYKLDHLFRSKRVSHENSAVIKTFHFFNLISAPEFLCVQYEPFKATSLNFKPFWLLLLFFQAFNDFFWAKWPSNWKALQMNSERLKHGMVSLFHPHSMCYKVDRVTTKTGCTLCTNWTISFEVCEGFRRKFISYKGISFF